MPRALSFFLTLFLSLLVGVSSGRTTDYGDDLADNRVSKTVGSSVTEYKFGNGANGANSNQLSEYGPAGQSFTYSFSYDNNGNRSIRYGNILTDIYTWDDENRLTSIELEGASSSPPPGEEENYAPPEEGSIYAYTYDHRGRRIVRDESAAGGDLTELTFSGGTSVQEASSSGTVQVELIRGSDWGGGIGGVLFTIRSGTRSYNAYNSRGDVISTSDGNGTATWQAAYEAFGTRTQEDGSNAERQRANTKDEDPTGLLNEGLRYRDLDAGVFISRDPAGFVDGPNVYAYVSQNLWSAFDPEGLFLEWLENAGARHYENVALGLGNNWGHSLFGEMPKAIRDVSDFDETFKLAERTGGAAKLVGGGLEATVAAMAAPISGGASMVGAFHGADMMQSGWSDIWSGQTSRTVTHQVIGGYSMMAGTDFETADNIGGYGDAGVSLGSGGLNSVSIMRAEANTLSSARVVVAENESMTRVGRWMNPDEYAKMQSSGIVQADTAGMHRVAVPATSDAYKAAPKGDIYVEYDLPSASLSPGGTDAWRTVHGPGSPAARLAEKKGLSVPELPKFENLSNPFKTK